MAMRKALKHQFRIRLYRPHAGYATRFGPWITVSIRIDRNWPNALQRVIAKMNSGAPDGSRYVID